MRRLWVLGVASILISYVTKYKLEPEKYFPSLADITDPQTLLRFASDRWEVLLLGLNLVAVYAFLNVDNGKYVQHAEGCFSTQNFPNKWEIVRGRYIISSVVVSNIFIFLGLAYFLDNVVVYCALFAVHHFIAVPWLFAFRWNVAYYFSAERFMPPDKDPHRQFILEHRKVIEFFLCKTRNVEREALTGAGYVVALCLALVNESWHVLYFAVPHCVAVGTEAVNQYFSHLERRDRNQGLRKIALKERRQFSAD